MRKSMLKGMSRKYITVPRNGKRPQESTCQNIHT